MRGAHLHTRIVSQCQVQLVGHTSYQGGIEQSLAALGRFAKPSRRVDILHCIALCISSMAVVGAPRTQFEVVEHVKEVFHVDHVGTRVACRRRPADQASVQGLPILTSPRYHDRTRESKLRLWKDAWPPNIDRVRL